MNKCVISALVLLVATWQVSECKPDGLFGHFGKVTEKVGQKTVEIGQRVQEDVKVVKDKITTLFTGQKDQKEHKENMKSSSEIIMVPPSQPETFPKLPPQEVTTKKVDVPDDRHQIVGSIRCLPTQEFIAGQCHDQA